MTLLYFRFAPKDALAVLLTPVAFVCRVPAAIPLCLGQIRGVLSAISVAFGILSWAFIQSVHTVIEPLKNVPDVSLLDVLQANGLASIGGLPLAVFWLGAQRNDRHKTRANLQTYIGLSTVVSGTILTLKGIITVASALMALPLFAIYGIGLWLGTHAFGIASEQTFRRIAYLTIFLSALVSLPLWDGLIGR